MLFLFSKARAKNGSLTVLYSSPPVGFGDRIGSLLLLLIFIQVWLRRKVIRNISGVKLTFTKTVCMVYGIVMRLCYLLPPLHPRFSFGNARKACVLGKGNKANDNDIECVTVCSMCDIKRDKNLKMFNLSHTRLRMSTSTANTCEILRKYD